MEYEIYLRCLDFMILQYAYFCPSPKKPKANGDVYYGLLRYIRSTSQKLKTWQLYWNPFIRFQKCRWLHMLTTYVNLEILKTRHLILHRVIFRVPSYILISVQGYFYFFSKKLIYKFFLFKIMNFSRAIQKRLFPLIYI